MMNLQQLKEQKKEMEMALKQMEEKIAEVTSEIEKLEKTEVKKTTKADVFFKAGEAYVVFMRSSGNRKFECTKIDLENNFVYGSYNGGTEKKYKATPVKNDNNMIVEYHIIVDNRTKLACGSKGKY